MRGEVSFEIRPVIELSIATSSLNQHENAEQLARSIFAKRETLKLVSTPDGWFVPLQEIFPRIEGFIELLILELLQYGNLEICGGFEIRMDRNILLKVPLSSNFRFAADFANAILALPPNTKDQEVFIGNDETVLLSSLDDITIIAPSRSQCTVLAMSIHLPTAELTSQLKSSFEELRRFTHTLESAWEKVSDDKPLQFNWLFGLDKLQI